ncbi:hypothetical protein [Methylorubrum extorquens]|uniref:hypothetical protein n=1 Tax=Methylorubrum extorquens TaxID=408 RepID=UPI002237A3B2|nr:hypothetical protein [Methylorubrum extorquens]UYW25348.1 hypothetical protein OKC48_19030 [Methylorubrum extorquens]UYW34793.1 hypothetical protein OKB92_12120 [Methylorubrum extorquens]
MGRRQDPGGAAREDQVESDRVESDRVETTKVKTAKAGFTDLVLVCRKCAKRQGVDRKQLGRAVKRAFREGARGDGSGKGAGQGFGKVRVLETGCLGPCPKRMLTLATTDSLARRRVILVDPALDTIGPAALTLAAVVPSPTASVVVFTGSETSPAAPADGAGNG